MASNKSVRLDYIDGLRALAAIMVYVCHVWDFTDGHSQDWWNPIHIGHTGVHLFLLLSGFCIFWPFANGKTMTLKEFARRRFHRIGPPFYAAFLLFAIIALAFHRLHIDWPELQSVNLSGLARQAASHALFIHNLLPNHIMAVAGPFWSIGLEVQLYIGLPILAAIAVRWGMGKALLFAAIITLSYRLYIGWYIGGLNRWGGVDPTLAYALNYSFLGRWMEFAMGMFAATLVARGTRIPSIVPLGWIGFLMLAGMVWFTHHFGSFYWLTDPLFGCAYFCLLMSAARQASLWHRFLTTKWLGRIGFMSYSIYLMHSPFLRWFIYLTDKHIHSALAVFWMAMLIFPLPIYGISLIFFQLVERRFLNTKPVNRVAAPVQVNISAQPVTAQ